MGRNKQAEAAVVKVYLDDDEEDEEKTEQDKLEHEMRELTSQLKKAEQQEAMAQDKAEKERVKQFSRQIQEGTFLKQPKV